MILRDTDVVLTQLGNADLLQVLPAQVLHDGHGIIAVLQQVLLVLRKTNDTEPLAQVRLGRAGNDR